MSFLSRDGKGSEVGQLYSYPEYQIHQIELELPLQSIRLYHCHNSIMFQNQTEPKHQLRLQEYSERLRNVHSIFRLQHLLEIGLILDKKVICP